MSHASRRSQFYQTAQHGAIALVEIPADFYRRMELHKAATGGSYNLLPQKIVKPVPELLPALSTTD